MFLSSLFTFRITTSCLDRSIYASVGFLLFPNPSADEVKKEDAWLSLGPNTLYLTGDLPHINMTRTRSMSYYIQSLLSFGYISDNLFEQGVQCRCK